jgi:VanZ family protein
MPIERWRIWCRWAFALGLAVVMALALAPPRFPTPSTGWDKANHALAFAVLALLGFAGYPRGKVAVLAALLAYGGLIEVLQGMTGYRSADWLDWVADSVGLAIGSMLTRVFAWHRRTDP